MNIFDEKEERLAIIIFLCTGVFGVLTASLANSILPSLFVKAYIGIIVVSMGILMIRNNQNDVAFSKRRLFHSGNAAVGLYRPAHFK